MNDKHELSLWAEENHGDFFATRYRVKETLFSGKSKFQQVDVVDTVGHGKMLFNDGLVMVSERDEFVYHDMIAHVPLFVHPNPRNVLVIGGGDGGTVREVLRHQSVEKCTMVEIDEFVVNSCKKHIPKTSCALDDKRANVIIDDGVKFVAETNEKFDVVLVDSTDPIGPATPLFGKEFYQNVHRILSEQGIAVAQFESPFFNETFQKSIMSIIAEVFEKRKLYLYTNTTYPGGLWSFSFASKGLCPIHDFDPNRVKSSGLEFKYYNPEIHRASFALPEFVKNSLKEFLN
jgi:spermidine synthase